MNFAGQNVKLGVVSVVQQLARKRLSKAPGSQERLARSEQARPPLSTLILFRNPLNEAGENAAPLTRWPDAGCIAVEIAPALKEYHQMITNRLGVVAALLITASVSSARAQAPQGLSANYIACHARAKGNTVQDNICAQGEMAAQDARLNKAYQQVMRQLAKEPSKKTALRDEERSWINKRDYDCKVDEHTTNEGCLVVQTAMRANELEKQVHF